MKNKTDLRVWQFFGVVYFFTGLLYFPILKSGDGMARVANKILMLTITFIPSFTGIAFVTIFWDKKAQSDFWRRVFRWPKAPVGAIALSLTLMPILTVISYCIAMKLAGQEFTLEYGLRMLSQLPLLVQFLLVEFFLGAVSEELGWRGYAIDELQKKYTALNSALIIGVIWAFWHTPAFFIPGLSQYEYGGLMSWNYLGMMAGVTAGSILHTWAYNNTGRSIAVAGVLMHFTQNATLIFLGGIFDQYSAPTLFWPILAILSIMSAGVLVWQYGPQTLAKRPKVSQKRIISSRASSFHATQSPASE